MIEVVCKVLRVPLQILGIQEIVLCLQNEPGLNRPGTESRSERGRTLGLLANLLLTRKRNSRKPFVHAEREKLPILSILIFEASNT